MITLSESNLQTNGRWGQPQTYFVEENTYNQLLFLAPEDFQADFVRAPLPRGIISIDISGQSPNLYFQNLNLRLSSRRPKMTIDRGRLEFFPQTKITLFDLISIPRRRITISHQ